MGAGAWVHWAPDKGTNIVWQAFRISLVKHACAFHRCDKHCLGGRVLLVRFGSIFSCRRQNIFVGCVRGGVGNLCRAVSVHLASTVKIFFLPLEAGVVSFVDGRIQFRALVLAWPAFSGNPCAEGDFRPGGSCYHVVVWSRWGERGSGALGYPLCAQRSLEGAPDSPAWRVPPIPYPPTYALNGYSSIPVIAAGRRSFKTTSAHVGRGQLGKPNFYSERCVSISYTGIPKNCLPNLNLSGSSYSKVVFRKRCSEHPAYERMTKNVFVLYDTCD